MNLAMRAALAGVVALLSACGGGGGAAPAPGDPPATGGTVVSGIVAVGAPLDGASVRSVCADGSIGPSTTANAQGRYDLRMPASCTGPYLLHASRGVESMFSFGGEPVNGIHRDTSWINVTPATNIIAHAVFPDLGHTAWPAPWSGQHLSPEQQLAMVHAASNVVGPFGVVNGKPATLEQIMYTEFEAKPGDPMDDLLENLRDHQGGVTTPALAEQVLGRGGNLAGGQPWKTLFAGGTSLALSGTHCMAGTENPVGAATVTLRTDGSNLRVDLVADMLDGPKTFLVGSTVGGDFALEVRGDSPYVFVSATGPESGYMSVSLEDGAPSIGFTYLGATASCKLANPVRRTDLLAFHPAARILSVVPPVGASGTCAATEGGAAYTYAINALGDVRFNGTSLAAGWLDAPHAEYSESLQFNLGGGSSYQVGMRTLPAQQGLLAYQFGGTYGVQCMSGLP
ncbi:MAG TPA: hypothetical protein VNB23_00910 [Ramlibacter sp.]|nr:hypothetical protein [Ramlibacter sp.]